MTLNEYQIWTDETAIYPAAKAIEYCALGLGDESGEVQGKVKKAIRDNIDINSEEFRNSIKKELGDVYWYLARLAKHFNLTSQEIIDANVEKLMSRKERNVLSGNGDNR